MYRDGPNGPGLLAAEIKSKNDKLRPMQKLLLSKLSTVMPVYVIQESHDGLLRESRINPGAYNGNQ